MSNPSLCYTWAPTPFFHLTFLYLNFFFLFKGYLLSQHFESQLPPPRYFTHLSQCVFDFKMSKHEFSHPSTTHAVSPSAYRQPPWCQTFSLKKKYFSPVKASLVSSNKNHFTIIYNYEHYKEVMYCMTPINSHYTDCFVPSEFQE